MSRTKVMIAEKRDQALLVAKAMGWQLTGDCVTGELEGDQVKLVWAAGHLQTLKEPQEVKEDVSWSDPNTLLPIPRTFERKVIPPRKGGPGGRAMKQPLDYLKTISKYVKGADEVIIATDPDREGESIGWQIVDYCRFKGPVRRLWLADGLDTQAVKKAMSSIKAGSETKAWHRASEARSRADWAYQFLVRAYTHYGRYGAFGPNLGGGSGRESVVSVGRVQTPTLKLVVDRDREIENFKPQDHFLVRGDFDLSSGSLLAGADYKPVVTREIIDAAPAGVSWQPSKVVPKDGQPEPLDNPLFVDKGQVDAFEARLKGAASQAFVHAFSATNKSKAPPMPYDLATLQGDLAKVLKVTAADAQKIAESLYQKGFTTYPRTEHAALPVSMYGASERNPVLNHLAGHQELASQARHAQAIHDGKHATIKSFKPACFQNKPMEHYGIVPTHKPANLSSLDARERTAYLMIAKRYIQALYPPAKIAEQKVELRVPVADLLGHDYARFQAKAEQVIEPGWMAAFGQAKAAQKSIKAAKKGDPANLKAVHISTSTTSPPPRYNDKTIVAAMRNVGRMVRDPEMRKLLKDASGLGTPATRSNIIETLIARGYMERRRGALISLDKGRALVDALPDWLRSPETTAVWENDLNSIAGLKDDKASTAKRDTFVNAQVDLLEQHLRDLKKGLAGKLMDKPIGGGGGTGKPSPKFLKYVKMVSDVTGEPLPKGYTKDRAVCSAFVDKHKEDFEAKMASRPSASERPPSEKMASFARKLIQEKGLEEPEGVFERFDLCKQFLDTHVGGGKSPGRKPGGRAAPRGGRRPAGARKSAGRSGSPGYRR